MCEISVPLRSTMQPTPKRQLHTAPWHIVACHCTDHVKRGAVSGSGSGVEPGLYSPCQHERGGTRSARQK